VVLGELLLGVDRPRGETDNGWSGAPGSWVQYTFAEKQQVREVRLVFDSNLHNLKRMPCSYPLGGYDVKIPAMMTRAFDLEIWDGAGRWQTAFREENNYQRLVKIPLAVETAGLGAAMLAAVGCGACASLDEARDRMALLLARRLPRPDRVARYAEQFAAYRRGEALLLRDAA
jgi:hypothetical protein